MTPSRPRVRKRKAETVLRRMKETVELLPIWMHRAELLEDLAELRRSLRDTRGDMRGGDADPKQKSCSQCGRRFMVKPCGPTHAAIQMARRDTRGKR